MKMGITFFGALIALIVLTSNEEITDQDRRIFKIVKIRSQSWMAENLNVSTYRNGDSIPEVKTAAIWSKLTTGAWCYYENKTEFGTKYGKLYNWYAVNDPRGLAPRGFHIPSDEEWDQLIANLGEEEAGAKIKARKGWKMNGKATNQSGFSGLPGGYRYNVGAFLYAGNNGCFWSSTESKKNKAWGRTLSHNMSDIGRDDGSLGSGLSVRCVVD
jgi:uncharacterized protein (TIGR02145 family)